MMNVTKERLHYLDVAKGLLIIGVVFIHMLLPLKSVENSSLSIHIVKYLGYNTWVLFYMPAFFIVSGICSNYNKSFKSFIISNIISLKIPIFFFIGVLGALAIRQEYGFSPLSIKWWFIRMFESGVWFLHAMFLSRIYYWIINNKLSNRPYIQLIICFVLYIIGFVGLMKGLYPMFWIFHSLALCIFLCIGNIFHVKFVNFGVYSAAVFCILVVGLKYIGYTIPYIVQNPVCINLIDSILILVLSVSGANAFLWICKFIDKSPILEYIGRYSLLIYILHSIFIDYFSNQLEFLDLNNNILTLSELFIELTSIISICLFIVYIFDRPYLRLIIGKKP